MRVLQVNKFFYDKGGTERYFFALSDALEKRGHEVVHFSMQHPENRPSPYSQHFVSEKRYDDGVGIRAASAFIRSREAATRIARLVHETRPDVAHLHNIYHQLTPSIVPVLEAAGVSIVMTLHDYKLVCPNYSLYDGRAFCRRCHGGRFYHAPLVRCSNRSVLRGALLAAEAYWQKWTRVYDAVACFIAPSKFIRDTFLADGFAEDRVQFLPAFVPPPGDGVADGREDLALPSRYLLYFGRLSPEKGLHTLIRAVARTPDVELVVAGDGPLLADLQGAAERAAPGRVRFVGHLSRRMLESVVRSARFVVVPTESPENAPFAVLESMALGVPVVVSSMGGLPELADRVGALVFTAGDADALSAQIARCWRDDALRNAVAMRSREVMAEVFSMEKHMAALEGIYERARIDSA